MAKEVTDSTLEETLKTDKLVMLDFWAPWCGPCRMIGPVVEEISNEVNDIVVGKVNVDENPEASTKYGIRSIPAIYFIKNGEVVDKLIGAVPKADLMKKIDANK
jgi:thioredoxin 1